MQLAFVIIAAVATAAAMPVARPPATVKPVESPVVFTSLNPIASEHGTAHVLFVIEPVVVCDAINTVILAGARYYDANVKNHLNPIWGPLLGNLRGQIAMLRNIRQQIIDGIGMPGVRTLGRDQRRRRAAATSQIVLVNNRELYIPERKPRQILAALGVLGIGAAAYEAWSVHGLHNEMAEVKGQVRDLDGRLRATAMVVADNTNLLANTSAQVRELTGFAKRLQTSTADLYKIQSAHSFIESAHLSASVGKQMLAAVNDLRRHLFPTSAIPPKGLSSTFTGLAHQAALRDHVLLLDGPEQLVRCPTTAHYNGTAMLVATHVPMAPRASTFNLHEFHPLPIPFNHNLETTFFPNFPVLAINPADNAYTAFTDAEVKRCQEVSVGKSCPAADMAYFPSQALLNAGKRRVKRAASAHRQAEATCLMALFNQAFDLFNVSCPFVMQAPKPAIARLGGGTFIVSAPNAHMAAIRCADNRTARVPLNGVSQVTLDPGCRASTEHFRFAAPLVLDPQHPVVIHPYPPGFATDVIRAAEEAGSFRAPIIPFATHGLAPLTTAQRSFAATAEDMIAHPVTGTDYGSTTTGIGIVAIIALVAVCAVLLGAAWYFRDNIATCMLQPLRRAVLGPAAPTPTATTFPPTAPELFQLDTVGPAGITTRDTAATRSMREKSKGEQLLAVQALSPRQAQYLLSVIKDEGETAKDRYLVSCLQHQIAKE